MSSIPPSIHLHPGEIRCARLKRGLEVGREGDAGLVKINKEKLAEVDSGCWVGRLIAEPCHWEPVTGMVVNHRPGGRLCSR